MNSEPWPMHTSWPHNTNKDRKMKFFKQKYSPLTDSVYFLKAGLDDVVNEFIGWQKPLKINDNRQLKIEELKEQFEFNLMRVLPINVTEIRRFLFHKTLNEWTVLISNTTLGTDSGAPSVIADRLKCELVRATNVPDATMFEYSNPKAHNEKDKLRYVYAVKEGRWEFSQYGTPLDFEDLERYQREKSIKNKLDSDLLIEYLMKLEIDYNSMDFYNPKSDIKGILVYKEGPMYDNDVALTLIEAQNYYSK